MTDTTDTHSVSIRARVRGAYRTATDMLALAGPLLVVGMIRLANELKNRFG